MFSRIKIEHVKDMSNLAAMRGIEHVVLPSPTGFPWQTFQFTTGNSKKVFDRLCNENDVVVDGTQMIDKMVDSVIEGDNPESIINDIIMEQTKYQITPGMANAMNQRAKYKCEDCGMAIPKYTGAYSKQCPNCGGNLVEL